MKAVQFLFFLGWILTVYFAAAEPLSQNQEADIFQEVGVLQKEFEVYKKFSDNLFREIRHELKKLINEQREREVDMNRQNRLLKNHIETLQRTLQEETLWPSARHPLPDTTNQRDHVLEKPEYKRSDDNGPLEIVVNHLAQRLDSFGADILALKNSYTHLDQTVAEQEREQGSVYIRWGGNTCSNESETLYSGYTAGSLYSQGSAANNLCLPPDPVFDSHNHSRYGPAEIYGTEYETCDEPECDMSVSCSVCWIPRSSNVMIAGTNVCPAGWHREYSGYLMADLPTRVSSEYVCVDKSHGYIPGSQGSQNGNLFYYTVIRCASLSCPPYVDGKTVLCVVCSK